MQSSTMSLVWKRPARLNSQSSISLSISQHGLLRFTFAFSSALSAFVSMHLPSCSISSNSASTSTASRSESLKLLPILPVSSSFRSSRESYLPISVSESLDFALWF